MKYKQRQRSNVSKSITAHSSWETVTLHINYRMYCTSDAKNTSMKCINYVANVSHTWLRSNHISRY
jgi:hypothetical protein